MKKNYLELEIEVIKFNHGKDVLNGQSAADTYFSGNGDDCGYDFWD